MNRNPHNTTSRSNSNLNDTFLKKLTNGNTTRDDSMNQNTFKSNTSRNGNINDEFKGGRSNKSKGERTSRDESMNHNKTKSTTSSNSKINGKKITLERSNKNKGEQSLTERCKSVVTARARDQGSADNKRK
jgi:hypothetical protein